MTNIARIAATGIAKVSLKLWLGADSAVDDLVDLGFNLFKSRNVNDYHAKLLSENWENITADIEKELEKIPEFKKIDAGDRQSFRLDVVQNLERLKLDASFFSSISYSETELERMLRRPLNSMNNKLAIDIDNNKTNMSRIDIETHNKSITQYSNTLISIVVPYIFSLSQLLPDFEIQANRKILRNQSELQLLVKQILEMLTAERESERSEGSKSKTSKDMKTAYRYKSYMKNRRAKLEVMGLDIHSFYSSSRIDISYTSLQVQTAVDNGCQRSLSAEEAVREFPRLLLRGGPGSGKTTILQWMSLLCSRLPTEYSKDRIEGHLPFLVALRDCEGSKPPNLEEIPFQYVDRSIFGIDAKWCERVFENETVLLLVDGVDEVPQRHRAGVRSWLQQILTRFPSARCVVTSRSSAIESGWLADLNFIDAHVEELSMSQASSLVNKWFRAKAEELTELGTFDIDRGNLELYRDSLLRKIEYERHIRRLTSSPLLCGLLCALALKQRGSLPSVRREIYARAIDMLVERRDEGYGIVDETLVAIELSVKIQIISQVAYWMMRNEKIEIEKDELIAQCELAFKYIPQKSISGHDFAISLIDRGGILQRIRIDTCAFVHLSIQEYLCAHALSAQGDSGFLLSHMDSPSWHEVFIFAAGMIENRAFVDSLMESLFEGAEENNNPQIPVLLLNCLDNASWLHPDLRKKVAGVVSRLLPPKSDQEAKAIASAGDLIVPLLQKHAYDKDNAQHCVSSLIYLGTEDALIALRQFFTDGSSDIQDKIIDSWEHFDQKLFAKTIFPLRGHFPSLRATNTVQLEAVSSIASIENLYVVGCNFIEIFPKSETACTVTNIRISDCRKLVDITSISRFKGLRKIEIFNCEDLAALPNGAMLDSLSEVAIYRCDSLGSIGSLRDCPELVSISLEECHDFLLEGLEDCGKLVEVHLINCGGYTIPPSLVSCVKEISNLHSEGID